MRVYLSLFRMRLMMGFQYRTSALAGMTTQFFWGFIYVMIYTAFYTSNPGIQPISLSQLIQVVWLQQAFLMFIMLWYRDNEIMTMISTGNIAYELSRPIDLYGFWYARLIAARLSGAILRSIPILIVTAFLPSPYTLHFPPTFLDFLLFAITLLLGLIIIVAISMLIYISVFYTLSPIGSLLIFSTLGEFFAGLVIPVPLMPHSLQILVYLLPFRYTSDLPFRIYAGNIGMTEAFISILAQLFWIVFLVLIGRIWMKQALKNVVVQGG